MSGIPESSKPELPDVSRSLAETVSSVPVPSGSQSRETSTPRIQALLYAVGAALIAGFLSWGIGERTYDYFKPSASGGSTSGFAALNREKGIANQKNATVAFGSFGAILGMLAGVAGGAVRRSFFNGAKAALTGLILAGIGGALASYLLAPIYTRFFSDDAPSLLLPFLIRGGVWATIGMAVGLAFGWGLHGFRGVPNALMGGLIGSVCGTVAFELANAVLFPGDRNDAVIPSSIHARLLAYLFVAVTVATGAVFLDRQRATSAKRPA